MELVALLILVSGSSIVHSQPIIQTQPLDLRIESVQAPSIVKVAISRTDGGKYRVWRDSNSWGAAHWRVLVIRGGALHLFRQDANLLFTRNIPEFLETSVPLRLQLDLRSRDWLGPDHARFAFESGDRIIVLYDVPPTVEANRDAVFNGILSAMFDNPD
jgi:hypothetical protein